MPVEPPLDSPAAINLLYVAPPPGADPNDAPPQTVPLDGGPLVTVELADDGTLVVGPTGDPSAVNASASTIPPDAPYPHTPAEREFERQRRQEELERARRDRDNHIRAVIDSNPTWTPEQKAAIIDAVLRLAHAADDMQWNKDVGLLGSCNEWVEKFLKDNFKLIQEMEKAGLVKLDPVGWDNNNTASAVLGLFGADPLGHAAVRITLPDGTVFYLDDTNRGGSDHMFGPGELPPTYVPGPHSTPPRTPWVPK